MLEHNQEHNHKKLELIVSSRNIRENLLYAIQSGDMQLLETYEPKMTEFYKTDSLDILKRVPNDPIRAYKNILLSYNTLYSYAAERGGLPAIRSHYTAEKYAMLIECSECNTDLQSIHSTMLYEYVNLVRNHKEVCYSPIVQKAIDYIEMNFAEEISIAALAETVHAHPSHLMREFKKELNMSIGSFIRHRRIAEAEQFLAHSSLPVTEIALLVGYSDLAYFCRVFKRLKGITPNQYRRDHAPSI